MCVANGLHQFQTLYVLLIIVIERALGFEEEQKSHSIFNLLINLRKKVPNEASSKQIE
jgi:hypothetical protein